MSVPLLIRKLCSQAVSDALIGELIADMHLSVLKMCVGQHYDLTRQEISLETAWQIAELKTGAVFSLASRTGARLATDDSKLLYEYTLFGHHLGMLIQIGDDWSDLRPREGRSDLARGSETTLPVAYAMSVLPQAERARLRTCLCEAKCSATAEAEALCLIEGAGTGLYLATKAIQHRRQAEAALEKAGPPSNARDELTKLLSSKAVSSLC
jgi:geranylgeranyl diphosphate synthase type I